MGPIHWVLHKQCCVFKNYVPEVRFGNTPHPLYILYYKVKLHQTIETPRVPRQIKNPHPHIFSDIVRPLEFGVQSHY
jgi:hypothetical protein